jgi:hypothetical protein
MLLPPNGEICPPLRLEQAVQLLQAWGGECASHEGSARQICELVGMLPLAVILAGRYLAHCSQLAEDYLAWLETTPLEALNMGERQDQSIPLLIERSLVQVSKLSQKFLAY